MHKSFDIPRLLCSHLTHILGRLKKSFSLSPEFDYQEKAINPLPPNEAQQHDANAFNKFDPKALQAAKEKAYELLANTVTRNSLPGLSALVSIDGQVVFKTGECMANHFFLLIR